MTGATMLQRAIATAVMVQLQMQVQLTVPIKDPTYDVSLGVIMYANYDVPTTINSTLDTPLEPFDVTRRRRRQTQRDLLYLTVEMLLESLLGVSGRACLLRSICEAAAWPLQHDGLVGELLHVLLTPSSTRENGALHADYAAAETLGRRSGHDCRIRFPACPASPLDLVSTLSTDWMSPP